MLTNPDFMEITATAEIRTSTHGNRAKCLQRLIRLDLPVPMTVALPFDTVRAIAAGQLPDLGALTGIFDSDALLSVRSSSQTPDWGGPGTILNIGMNDEKAAALAATHGADAADALYLARHGPRMGWHHRPLVAPGSGRAGRRRFGIGGATHGIGHWAGCVGIGRRAIY